MTLFLHFLSCIALISVGHLHGIQARLNSNSNGNAFFFNDHIDGNIFVELLTRDLDHLLFSCLESFSVEYKYSKRAVKEGMSCGVVLGVGWIFNHRLVTL